MSVCMYVFLSVRLSVCLSHSHNTTNSKNFKNYNTKNYPSLNIPNNKHCETFNSSPYAPNCIIKIFLHLHHFNFGRNFDTIYLDCLGRKSPLTISKQRFLFQCLGIKNSKL